MTARSIKRSIATLLYLSPREVRIQVYYPGRVYMRKTKKKTVKSVFFFWQIIAQQGFTNKYLYIYIMKSAIV